MLVSAQRGDVLHLKLPLHYWLVGSISGTCRRDRREEHKDFFNRWREVHAISLIRRWGWNTVHTLATCIHLSVIRYFVDCGLVLRQTAQHHALLRAARSCFQGYPQLPSAADIGLPGVAAPRPYTPWLYHCQVGSVPNALMVLVLGFVLERFWSSHSILPLLLIFLFLFKPLYLILLSLGFPHPALCRPPLRLTGGLPPPALRPATAAPAMWRAKTVFPTCFHRVISSATLVWRR